MITKLYKQSLWFNVTAYSFKILYTRHQKTRLGAYSLNYRKCEYIENTIETIVSGMTIFGDFSADFRGLVGYFSAGFVVISLTSKIFPYS